MDRRFWRVLGVHVLRFGALSCAAAWIVSLTIPARPVPINVRWTPDVTDAQRIDLERRFRLSDGRPTEGTTFAYLLTDTSTANIRAIVQHPKADDTSNLNRRRFRPAFMLDRSRRIVAFGVIGGAVGSVLWLAVPVFASVLGAPVLVPQAMLVLVALSAPAALAAGTILVLLAAAVGYEPLWQSGPPLTLSQAAFAADRVRLSQMIDEGADPNAGTPVLMEGSAEVVLTPLEAAVMSHDLDTVEFLARVGALIDAASAPRLVCLARRLGHADIVTYLERSSPSAARVSCEGVDVGPSLN